MTEESVTVKQIKGIKMTNYTILISQVFRPQIAVVGSSFSPKISDTLE